MDALRKQLDQLMGANRNGDVREVNRKYYDRDVCRLYLVGLCPHELFQLTVTKSSIFVKMNIIWFPMRNFTVSIRLILMTTVLLLFLFQKMDMGPCPKVHSLQLREEYPFIASIFIECAFQSLANTSILVKLNSS